MSSNGKVIGESAAVALSNLYQASSDALSNSIQNAVFAQQQSNLIHQATTTQGVNRIDAVDTESVAGAPSPAGTPGAAPAPAAQAHPNVCTWPHPAPGLRVGNLYAIISQSLGLTAQNAVFAAQQSNRIHQAATPQGVNLIYAVDPVL